MLSLLSLNKGKLIIGTEANPYNSKLNIVLYGFYSGSQLPMIGNKVLSCMNC